MLVCESQDFSIETGPLKRLSFFDEHFGHDLRLRPRLDGRQDENPDRCAN